MTSDQLLRHVDFADLAVCTELHRNDDQVLERVNCRRRRIPRFFSYPPREAVVTPLPDPCLFSPARHNLQMRRGPRRDTTSLESHSPESGSTALPKTNCSPAHPSNRTTIPNEEVICHSPLGLRLISTKVARRTPGPRFLRARRCVGHFRRRTDAICPKTRKSL